MPERSDILLLLEEPGGSTVTVPLFPGCVTQAGIKRDEFADLLWQERLSAGK
ncbi:hypothetical protein [Methanoculleus sp. 7T]|uniref:hypothetical protein n=1 Tax=Methanoculleus sp. 7T TaxID=2937282 RepID=UPI0020C0C82B|nr:hypothetical protein [Methanoculleus sp. 7T]MCK8519048.1 hypothetical protein [Methanoculleus sp. 7T]